MNKVYDLIIIGAGPAGITAGIYAKNFGLDCLIIGEYKGGLVNGAYKVENYPGIFNITGKELSKKFEEHRKYLKIPLKKERVLHFLRKDGGFKTSTNKNQYFSKTIILCFGTEVKKLNIKNIEKFEGKGVYYRIGDSASFYKNKTMAVIGGGNSAVMSACALAEEASKVYLICRKGKLRADAIWACRLEKIKKVEIIYNVNIIELKGRNKLEKVILDNGRELNVDGLLIEAGIVPDTYLLQELGIKTDEKGYIVVDKAQATNIKGIFAAGDATSGSNEFRQIITAAAEGAIAVLSVFNYLKK